MKNQTAIEKQSVSETQSSDPRPQGSAGLINNDPSVPFVDPFDPVNQRISPNYVETVGVKQVLTTVPIRKPNNQDFFRVRGEQEYQLDTLVLQLKEDRETYFVAPELQDALIDELVPVRLYLTMNRQGVLALWPARLPGGDGKTNDWWESALEASGMAMQSWIRMSADMSLGAYRIFQAKGELSPPVWPEGEFRDFLRIAFGKNMIDSLDHPIVQRGVCQDSCTPNADYINWSFTGFSVTSVI